MWSAGHSGTHGSYRSPSSPSYFEVRVHPSVGRGIPPRTSFVRPGLGRRACTAVLADPDPRLLRARWLRRDRWRSGWALLGEWRPGPCRALRAVRPTVAPPGWGRGHGPPSANGGDGPWSPGVPHTTSTGPAGTGAVAGPAISQGGAKPWVKTNRSLASNGPPTVLTRTLESSWQSDWPAGAGPAARPGFRSLQGRSGPP
jgi:hypothetical protein